MRVTKRERYALRMMMELASRVEEAAPVGVRSIAERQDIAPRYLEQIAADLRRAGLVRSKQGQTGGYVLSRKSRDISVGEILAAVNGSAPLVECAGEATSCPRGDFCGARSFWTQVEALVGSVFDSWCLDDLLSNRVPSTVAPSPSLSDEPRPYP